MHQGMGQQDAVKFKQQCAAVSASSFEKGETTRQRARPDITEAVSNQRRLPLV